MALKRWRRESNDVETVSVADGKFDGTKDGTIDEINDGKEEGVLDGSRDGNLEGKSEGWNDGNVDGITEGKDWMSLLARKMEKMKWEPMVKMTGLMKVTTCGIDGETVGITDGWREAGTIDSIDDG